MEFTELAKKIAERDKHTFDALMEFEQTKKIRTKIRMNFTIDRSIASNFRRHCKAKRHNMSAMVEKLISEYLKAQI